MKKESSFSQNHWNQSEVFLPDQDNIEFVSEENKTK
jgi:hypothetical protein